MTSDVDFVFVGKNNDLTKQAVRTALDNCDKDMRVKIMIEPFDGNYNQALNRAILRGNAPYVFACNNDLIFHRGSIEEMLYALKAWHSAGAWCPKTHSQWWGDDKPKNRFVQGYQTGKIVPGWIIGMRRETWKTIGMFNTDYSFWCSDNVYCEQLKKHNLSHVLCRDAHVTHLQSQTLNTIDKQRRHQYTTLQLKKFKKEYG